VPDPVTHQKHAALNKQGRAKTAHAAKTVGICIDSFSVDRPGEAGRVSYRHDACGEKERFGRGANGDSNCRGWKFADGVTWHGNSHLRVSAGGAPTLQDLSNSLSRMKRFSRDLFRKYVIYITGIVEWNGEYLWESGTKVF
jgi:hypothetical protein